MKVKIGDKVHDTNEEPIMLVFESNEEKKGLIRNIENMLPEAFKYCTFPDTIPIDEIKKFMEVT